MNAIGRRVRTAASILSMNPPHRKAGRIWFSDGNVHRQADDIARDRSEHHQDSIGKFLSINRRSREVGGAGVSSGCDASFAAGASL